MALKSNEARGEVFECFGDKLKKLREEKGMTQAELSKELNTSKTSIANYEGGTRKVPLDIIVKISKYFSVSVDDLLDIPFPKTGENNKNEFIETKYKTSNNEIWLKEVGQVEWTEEDFYKLVDYAKLLKKSGNYK
jgi:Predicted transcriptional regulator